jgi:membrane protease YdiL (CAAX protease family)
MILIAMASLLTTYYLNQANFMQYFSIGNINALTEKVTLFGINEGDKWLSTGLSLLATISIATGVFLYFQLKPYQVDWQTLKPAFFWIILFSLTNSFAEEMVFRTGIIAPLSGLMDVKTMFLISAILFGIPHFFGMPSGIIGVLMAGLLGFVLAKSMYETNGIFWAWLIHFIQDILIIGTMFLMSNKNSPI